jgi:hypothetical protein
MKNTWTILILICGFLFPVHAQAARSTGDGAWAVGEYGKETVFLHAVDIYREDPDKGARPTFMVNFGGKKGCYVSLGLTMLAEDIPRQISKKEMLDGLKRLMEQSEFLADKEILTIRDAPVQAVDMGGVIYVRKIIDSDSLASFMLAKIGVIRIKNKDAVIKFSMLGFDTAMKKIMNAHCR